MPLVIPFPFVSHGNTKSNLKHPIQHHPDIFLMSKSDVESFSLCCPYHEYSHHSPHCFMPSLLQKLLACIPCSNFSKCSCTCSKVIPEKNCFQFPISCLTPLFTYFLASVLPFFIVILIIIILKQHFSNKKDLLILLGIDCGFFSLITIAVSIVGLTICSLQSIF